LIGRANYLLYFHPVLKLTSPFKTVDIRDPTVDEFCAGHIGLLACVQNKVWLFNRLRVHESF